VIVVLARDLIIASRFAEAAARARVTMLRIDDPTELPEPDRVRHLFVDWGSRGADWPAALDAWLARAGEAHRPSITLFGPHTDLAAHADARAAGLGPMMARSKLVSRLPELLAG
jgi:hypothetical protein